MATEARRWFAWTINVRMQLLSIDGELVEDSPAPHFGPHPVPRRPLDDVDLANR